MVSDDSRAAEATTVDDPVLQPQKWRFGPLSLLVIGLLFLFDLVAIVFWKSYSDTHTAIMIGLCFGQAGAAAAWAFSKAVRRRWLAVVGALAFAVLMALLFAVGIDGNGDAEGVATKVVMFMGYSSAIMLTLFFFRLAASRWMQEPSANWQPRFGVSHLLGAMVAVAVLGVAVRFAMPNLGALAEFETIMLVAGWTLIAIAAGVLLLDHLVSGWRIGLYAAVGLGLTVLLSSLSDWEIVIYATAIQMTVLALAILIPQLDRYHVRVTFGPHNAQLPTNDLPQ